MPKDLTKASLKEFDSIEGGDKSRFRWTNGKLELVVPPRDWDEDDADD